MSRLRISSFIILNFVALLLLFPSKSQAQNDEIIKVESTFIVLNVSITDSKAKTVGGLKKSVFTIFEDGKEQEIDFFQAEETPFAAVILIDSSGSMEQIMSVARAAAISFLNGLRIDDQVAIYNFDSKVSQIQDFSNSRDVTDKIFNLKADGWTVLYDAIDTATKQLAKRTEKRKSIIVLSDGADTRSGISADKVLKNALASDVSIYTVDMSNLDGGKTQAQAVSILKNFSEKSGGQYIDVSSPQTMANAFKNIVAELGSQYTIAYYPTNSANNGKWRSIEVKVAKPNLTIKTRKGYYSKKS
jgi:Ca-activated chloride channel homolog